MGIFEDEAWGSDAEAVEPSTLHNVLDGRSAANAHPMGAITGLTDALTAIDGRLDDIEENPGGTFDGVHNDLDGREIPDAHPSSAISMDPTTPGDWTTNPESVQDALDELAAREIATDPLVVEYLDSGDTMATDTTCAYIVTAGGPTIIGLPASHDTGRAVIINQSGETALLDHPGSSMVGIALLPTSSAALLHWIADGSVVGLSVGPAWLVHQLVPNPPGVEADGDVLTLDDQNGVAWRTPEAGGGSGDASTVLVQLPAGVGFTFGTTITHFTEELPALRAGDLVRVSALLSWRNSSTAARSFGVVLRLGATSIATTPVASYSTGFTRAIVCEATLHVLSTTSQAGGVTTIASSNVTTAATGVATENVAAAGVEIALNTVTHSACEARLDAASISIVRAAS